MVNDWDGALDLALQDTGVGLKKKLYSIAPDHPEIVRARERGIPVLKRAEALVFPSFIEGFGFPVLEAMDCWLPVITSKTSSLGEIAGDAAVLVDPGDCTEIKEAMRKVVSDAGFRNGLIERGHARAKNFSWEKSARELLEIIKNV